MSVHGKDAVILIALVAVEATLIGLAIHSPNDLVVRTTSIMSILIGIFAFLMFGIGQHETPRA